MAPRERERAASLSKIVLDVVYCRAEAVTRFDPSCNRICRNFYKICGDIQVEKIPARLRLRF